MEGDIELSCDIPPDKTSNTVVQDDNTIVSVTQDNNNNNTSEVCLLANNFKALSIKSRMSIAKPARKNS